MAGLTLPSPVATVATYQLLSAAAAAATAKVPGVKVYDYGQGDCNAVVADPGTGVAAPVLYFDIGGGKHAGSRTHPWHEEWSRGTCPDLTLAPTIVLSHWDGDHHSTAYYIVNQNTTNKKVPTTAKALLPALQNTVQWLVPRRCKYPSTLDFVRTLKNISCWPDATAQHTFELNEHTRIVIERAFIDQTGEFDPNLDGLAVRVERLDAAKNVIEELVMPGDAPYHIIPSLEKKEVKQCVGLLAFHHGSETHLGEAEDFIPPPKPNVAAAKIAFTFGLKLDRSRCHHHPAPEAVEKYKSLGWTNVGCISGVLTPWPPADKESNFTATTGRTDVDLPFVTPEPAPPPPASAPPSTPATTVSASSSSGAAPRPTRKRRIVMRWTP